MTGCFDSELREQPAVLARLLAHGRERAEAIAEHVRLRGPAFGLLAARGSSDNAARYGQYVLGVRNRLAASLAAPSIVTRYQAAPRLESAFVVALSQSGRSPDVVGVVEEARRQGALSLAITNDADSPLAHAAELVFPLEAGPEKAVAATKTYTAQLMALALLSAALDAPEGGWRDLEALPYQVAEAIDLNAGRASLADPFWREDRLVVVGRGYNLSTVFEVALKVKETSGVMADPYSSADFLHGPVALLQRDLPVMVVAPGGDRFEDLDEVVALARRRGSRLLAISDDAALLAKAQVALPMPAGVPEWLSPLVAVVPGQLWARALAHSRGSSPDAPRGLTKVTLTR